MRLMAFLIAGFWFLLGLVTIGIGTLAVSLFMYPCLIGDPLCDTAAPLIVDVFFFGRLPVPTVQMLIYALTLFFILLGMMAFFVFFLAGRFSVQRDAGITILSLISYNIAFTLVLLSVYLVSGHIDPWLGYAEQGCPSDGRLLCGPVNDFSRLAQIDQYRDWLRFGRTTVILLISFLVLVTALLWLTRNLSNTTRRTDRFQHKDTDQVCGLCGLTDPPLADANLANEYVPYCAFCQPYFRVEVAVIEQAVNSDLHQLDIKLHPLNNNTPMPRPVLEGELGRNLHLSKDNLHADGWNIEVTNRGRSKFVLRPSQPGFFTGEQQITLPVERKRNVNSNLDVEIRVNDKLSQTRRWKQHRTITTVNAGS